MKVSGGAPTMVKPRSTCPSTALPAVVLVAETSCCPVASGVVGVQLHAPATTLALQTCVPSTTTVTVSPVVPVPENVGSVCVVTEPLPGASTVKTPVSSVSTV